MTSRASRKDRRVRLSCGLGVLIFASCLAAASDEAARSRVCADPCGGPTNFDYLILASMADSRHPLAMAGYRRDTTYRTALEISHCHL
jgi:hypothetical protein